MADKIINKINVDGVEYKIGNIYQTATSSEAGLMSATDKEKLIGIEVGANVNVQADWNATSGDAYIKNKPTIPAEVTQSTVSGWGFTKNTGTYSKPSGGIPASDMALSFTGTPSSTNKVVTKDTLDAAVAGASNYLGTVASVSGLSTTAKKGDFYRVSTAWTGVHVGDILIAEQDNPAAAVITSGTNGYTCLHNELNTDTHDTNIAGTGIAVSGTRGNTISLTDAVQTTLANADTDHTNLGGHTVGVNVPSNAKFTDTDTKVTSATNHYSPTENSGSALNASGATATDITGGSGVQVVTGLKRDAKGHVTGVVSACLKSTDTNTQYKLSGTFDEATNTLTLGLTTI